MTVAPPPRPDPHRHRLRWDQTDASGRGGHQAAGHRVGGHRRAGRWTGGQRTAGPPDPLDDDPGDRTPDGLDTGRLDSPIPDDRSGWVDTACWPRTAPPTPRLASWPCRPRRRRSTAGCRLQAPPGKTPSGRATTRTAQQHGPPRAPRCYGRACHRCDGQLQVLLRRPAGASAHCCRVLELDGTRGGQWDEGKVSGCRVRLVREVLIEVVEGC